MQPFYSSSDVIDHVLVVEEKLDQMLGHNDVDTLVLHDIAVPGKDYLMHTVLLRDSVSNLYYLSETKTTELGKPAAKIVQISTYMADLILAENMIRDAIMLGDGVNKDHSLTRVTSAKLILDRIRDDR